MSVRTVRRPQVAGSGHAPDEQGHIRLIDVLIAVHGVLRAGAAFVMLDPDDPADAILRPGEVWRAWLTVGFGLVLIGAGLAVIARRT